MTDNIQTHLQAYLPTHPQTDCCQIYRDIVRKHIFEIVPYASARDEFSEALSVMLDANENPCNWLGGELAGANSGLAGKQLNRYPDPRHLALRTKFAERQNTGLADQLQSPISPEHILLGNGSDEPIDLLIRMTCQPGLDYITVLPPTYGMYEVCASINNVGVKKIELLAGFQPNIAELKKAAGDPHAKILFLCSPNNPTGNLLNSEFLKDILSFWQGLVVVDEAYVDFARNSATDYPSVLAVLAQHPKLVVLQTMSKAWGLAGMRLGVCYAWPELISLLARIKPPYNINALSLELALVALRTRKRCVECVDMIVRERERLSERLQGLECVRRVYESNANFLLTQFHQADVVYAHLLQRGIVVRNRSSEPLCENCLRITVGLPEENDAVIEALRQVGRREGE